MTQGFTGKVGRQRGDRGAMGPMPPDAYDIAKAAGYPGTREQYTQVLATVDGNAMGLANVPLLLAGQSVTVQVTMNPPMRDLNYAVAAIPLISGGLLGALRVNSTAVVSTTRIDVTVQNTGLASLGGSVLVTAVR